MSLDIVFYDMIRLYFTRQIVEEDFVKRRLNSS